MPHQRLPCLLLLVASCCLLPLHLTVKPRSPALPFPSPAENGWPQLSRSPGCHFPTAQGFFFYLGGGCRSVYSNDLCIHCTDFQTTLPMGLLHSVRSSALESVQPRKSPTMGWGRQEAGGEGGREERKERQAEPSSSQTGAASQSEARSGAAEPGAGRPGWRCASRVRALRTASSCARSSGKVPSLLFMH